MLFNITFNGKSFGLKHPNTKTKRTIIKLLWEGEPVTKGEDSNVYIKHFRFPLDAMLSYAIATTVMTKYTDHIINYIFRAHFKCLESDGPFTPSVSFNT